MILRNPVFTFTSHLIRACNKNSTAHPLPGKAGAKFEIRLLMHETNPSAATQLPAAQTTMQNMGSFYRIGPAPFND
jgi:hypothetical protein